MQAETNEAKYRRYDEVIETQCKAGCKAYKPRTKGQCNICKYLLQRHDSDLVRHESIMLDGTRCKGYQTKLQED